MDIIFKKKLEDLRRDVALKSMDLEERLEEVDVELASCRVVDKFIDITPKCVRCNLCFEECPVDAISESSASKPARILDNCVKCEICAQTCPVRCINVVESTATIGDEDVTYNLEYVRIPHRLLRMKKIEVTDRCTACGTCTRFCPTGAIQLDKEIAVVDESICIGCGACVNVCPSDAVELERELGPVIETRRLLVDQDACVECLVCEENCPTGAIRIEDGEVVVDKDKCILCEVCSTRCPVAALKLERLADES